MSDVINVRENDLPATRGMLYSVRDELKADYRALDHKVDAVKDELKQDIYAVKADVEKMFSAIENLTGSIHRMETMAEAQRADNRIVLDGIKNLYQRQERTDTDISEIKTTLNELAKTKPKAH